MPSPTQETKTILDALRESRREIREEIQEEESRLSELRARECEMAAQIDRLEGHPLDAEAALAAAAFERNPSAETRQALHVAQVRASAAYHLRVGIVPSESHVWRRELEEEMDRQRAEVRQ